MSKNIRHRYKRGRIQSAIILAYAIIALLAPIIANEKPLFISMNGKNLFPALSSDPYIMITGGNGEINKVRMNNVDWKKIAADKIIFPPVCWSPEKSDLLNIFKSPFGKQYYSDNGVLMPLPKRYRHFLGTGKTGNDVFASLIHGARTSISIGFFSMLIALGFGIILGILAGFFGDEKIYVRKGGVILFVLMIIPAWFYGFYLRTDVLKESFESSFILGFVYLLESVVIFTAILTWPFTIRFGKNTFLNKKIFVPVDSIISRSIEIFLSLPRLILILTLAAISRPSVMTIIIIIGITSWTEMARLVRAQVLQLREMSFIDAARAMGIGTGNIIRYHLLPNIKSQVHQQSRYPECREREE